MPTALRARVLQIAISRTAGSRRRRSLGSEATTCCPVRRAQITTWASTMSDVPLAASSLPTLVASTRPRSITSVVGCRTRRASRACRSGRRIAWASAVAGTVMRAPVSRARARRTTTRRSFRSRAIRPPRRGLRPASGRRPAPALRDTEYLISPGTLAVGERTAGFLQRLGEQCPPPCHVIQGDADSVLHESGNAGRNSRLHEGADPFELGLVEGIVTFFDAIPVTIP